MAVHHHSTVFTPRTISLGLSRADRKAVEAQIETLIALLDELDGDCDLEDDDPAGTMIDAGEGDEREVLETLPIYGVDQSSGPINERQAYRAHQMKLYEAAA